MAERYIVCQDHDALGPPGCWSVVDSKTGQAIKRYFLRTNWIDGRAERPYGPKAAAEEIARRLNGERETQS